MVLLHFSVKTRDGYQISAGIYSTIWETLLYEALLHAYVNRPKNNSSFILVFSEALLVT